jgi:hypothetical protein
MQYKNKEGCCNNIKQLSEIRIHTYILRLGMTSGDVRCQSAEVKAAPLSEYVPRTTTVGRTHSNAVHIHCITVYCYSRVHTLLRDGD